MISCEMGQGGQKLRRWDDATGVVVDRLAKDGGQFRTVPCEGRLQKVRAIIGHDDDVLFESSRQAGRAGIDSRRVLWSETVGGRADRVHDLIVIAVEIALEFQ